MSEDLRSNRRGSTSIDLMATSPTNTMQVPTHGRLSVALQRKPSTVAGPNLGNLNISTPEARKLRVVLGRPTRVFWDLETCPVAGPDYFPEIVKSIEQRVYADTRAENFEIYAAIGHAAHLSSEVYKELLNFDINFNLAKPDLNPAGIVSDLERQSGSGNPVEEDLYQQITKYVDSQCRQTSLFPYVLLITGDVKLISRMEDLEKRSKIVYAVRKEKATDFRVGNLAYDYLVTRGIDNPRT